jgi:aconitate hydratase
MDCRRSRTSSNARILGMFGDKITTDHISPAGSIKKESPAGEYLLERQVRPQDFNQYGTRRGNHEVMMRGTFANIRIKNHMVKDADGKREGRWLTRSTSLPARMSIFDASMRYRPKAFRWL